MYKLESILENKMHEKQISKSGPEDQTLCHLTSNGFCLTTEPQNVKIKES